MRCMRFALRICVFVAVSAAGFAAAAGAARAQFPEARMIIEFNSSAEDLGVQFFLDAEEWVSVKIFDPHDTLIFNATAAGAVAAQGGGTELFLESVEPPTAELSFEQFFARFPEGRYRFEGRTAAGNRLTSRVLFSHDIPAGPEIVSPAQLEDGCPQGVAIPAVVGWEEVTEDIDGDPIDIVGYEVIVENGQVFDIHLAADATQVTVPAEFLTPATDYIFEVLAIESGGNQTITEGCFRTAN